MLPESRLQVSNVEHEIEKINTTSTLSSMHNQRAGNQILSKLAQKQQQQMGKKSMAYQVSEDDEDSEDEELLVEDAPVAAPFTRRWSKVAEAPASESFIGKPRAQSFRSEQYESAVV